MGKTPGKGRQSTSNKPKSQAQKRPRASSGAMEEDTDVLLDTVLGALSDPDNMQRFITSLCAIPDLKTKLVEHLIPTLDQQVKHILEPLKTTVNELQTQLKASGVRCNVIEMRQDDLEQYTRRQNIRISGFEEQEGESTDDIIVDFAKNALNLDINPSEIDRRHRVGRKGPSKPSRNIIVRFVSYKTKVKFMESRKATRAYNSRQRTSHFISEDLTRKRSNVAFQARKLKREGTIKDTWTYDSKIFIKSHNDTITVCTDVSSLPRSPVASGNKSA